MKAKLVLSVLVSSTIIFGVMTRSFAEDISKGVTGTAVTTPADATNAVNKPAPSEGKLKPKHPHKKGHHRAYKKMKHKKRKKAQAPKADSSVKADSVAPAATGTPVQD